MDAITASPMKLRDGSWGARAASPDVEIGQTVRIRTRAGKTWDAVVTRIQERSLFDRETHCATRSLDRAPRAPRPVAASRSNGRCRECGGPIRNAPHHKAMGGLCGQCAFDEYDC